MGVCNRRANERITASKRRIYHGRRLRTERRWLDTGYAHTPGSSSKDYGRKLTRQDRHRRAAIVMATPVPTATGVS